MGDEKPSPRVPDTLGCWYGNHASAVTFQPKMAAKLFWQFCEPITPCMQSEDTLM